MQHFMKSKYMYFERIIYFLIFSLKIIRLRPDPSESIDKYIVVYRKKLK